jgi:hypothetical protein
MKYIIIMIAMLAIFCLGISSLSEEVSLVDNYIAKSQSEKATWSTKDVFGAATPNEAKKIWESELQNNTTLQSNVTALNSTANVGNVTTNGISETESLVDEYIAKSLNQIGSWKSNDAFGSATPSEARKAALNQT